MALLMSTMTPIEFLILDEHTAALDPKTAELIMQLTDKIVKEKQLTTIMVTHNLRYAVEYGNRLVMMHNGHMILDKRAKRKKIWQSMIFLPYLMKSVLNVAINTGDFKKM